LQDTANDCEDYAAGTNNTTSPKHADSLATYSLDQCLRTNTVAICHISHDNWLVDPAGIRFLF